MHTHEIPIQSRSPEEQAAIDARFQTAIRLLYGEAEGRDHDPKNAEGQLKELADGQGDPRAQFNLYLIHSKPDIYQRYGITCNEDQASHYLDLACQQKNPRALLARASFKAQQAVQMGWSKTESHALRQQALHDFQQAITLDPSLSEPSALIAVALQGFVNEKKTIDKKIQEAKGHLTEAGGYTRGPQRAIEILIPLADQEQDPEAQFQLFTIYNSSSYGSEGIKQNRTLALNYLALAVQQDHPQALVRQASFTAEEALDDRDSSFERSQLNKKALAYYDRAFAIDPKKAKSATVGDKLEKLIADRACARQVEAKQRQQDEQVKRQAQKEQEAIKNDRKEREEEWNRIRAKQGVSPSSNGTPQPSVWGSTAASVSSATPGGTISEQQFAERQDALERLTTGFSG